MTDAPHPDLRATVPPVEWGVEIDEDALISLAKKWQRTDMPLPTFDYPGTPSERDEAWWFDYVTLAVSVLACLWPPEGEQMWSVDLDGQSLDDAPGIFAVFTKALRANPSRDLLLSHFESLSDQGGRALFAGSGTLQLVDARVALLGDVASTIRERWDGSVRSLVEEADRDASEVAALLTSTMPGYYDRPNSASGVLCFDKLAHLAAALMAAGVGWSFTGFEDFPVYPDYMLPRVFRHHGVMRYSSSLSAMVDQRVLIEPGSDAELAIRWATIYCGERLHQELRRLGNPVDAPGLDYHLWSQAVLGPDADLLGEHHRTITMKY